MLELPVTLSFDELKAVGVAGASRAYRTLAGKDENVRRDEALRLVGLS